MKKLSMKTLITTILCLGLFGIVRAEETTTTAPAVTVSGELSTDITFGDATTFSSPYMGLTFSGDGWVVSTNLANDMVNVEEAKYSWSVVDGVTLTFGSQAEPYGLAWGLHRPSDNWFVSTPREHSVTNGLGVGVDKWGVGINLFYGGGEEDDYWATKFSYNLSLLGIDSNVGLSLNSDEAQLLDVSVSSNIFETSLEYDLSEEADGAYWARSVVKPSSMQGAFLLLGYNSDEVVTYGVGYKCSDSFKVVSEFTSGEDADGNDIDNDFAIRSSYSF